MINNKSKSSLFALAAFYLLYLAYQLFEGRNNTDASMPPALLYLFIALFVIAAGGILWYAWKMWKQADKEQKEQQEENQPK